MAKKSTDDRDCTGYYAATRGRPPRETLLRALAAAAQPDASPGRRAIDLGCGAGRDTLPLLGAGWHALAIDAERTALAALRAATPVAWQPRLVTREASFERTSLPAADLVNASFCLFFIDRPALLRSLFSSIVAALAPGGRFAGQLLGPRDSWVRRRQALGFDRSSLATLLAGLEPECLVEEENDGVTPKGEAKHWHVWHVNAVKPRQHWVRASWRRS
jgi:SAM-dependent methyltransferase